MDKEDIGIITTLVVTAACISLFSYYVGFNRGAKHERVELGLAMVAQTEDIYFQGRGDAEKDCRAGLIK